MSLYNYFLTHPFGPGARTLEWIYLSRTGGGDTSLDGEPTWSADDSGQNCRIVALDNEIAEVWQLIPGTQASDPTNGWVVPLDFDASQNAKVWHRLFCFSTGGSSGGTTFVLNEVPAGAINGSNLVFTTSQPFQETNINVYLNGLRQRYAIDYSLPTSETFQLTSPPQVGDSIIVDYVPL